MRAALWIEEFLEARPGITKPERILNPKFYEGFSDDMVIVKDISFTSLCAHHLLPFTGFAAVGYIPNECIVGISKLNRLVQEIARRATLQEVITNQVVEVINEALKPQGVIVVLKGQHMCTTIRGVKDTHSQTVTSAVRGVFKDNPAARAEFLSLVKEA